ncbi:MAG: hypothetical protein QOI95_355 [Acidimicrobiaceae bacterium]
MMPLQAQLHIDGDVSAGTFPMTVFAAPGFHGPAGTGMHGIGVSTPSAAAVAAATIGFEGLVHMPKGGMFIIGTMSLIVAAGFPSMSTRLAGSTLSVDGAMPKLQVNMAVAVTFGGMSVSPYFFESLTDTVSCSPVVVTRQTILRSLPSFQLRAEGNRYV